MPTPHLSIRDLLVTSAERTVLGIPQLDLPLGKTTVVLGPGGSGKSILLRYVATSTLAPDLSEQGRLQGRPTTVAFLDQVRRRSMPPKAHAALVSTMLEQPAELVVLDEPEVAYEGDQLEALIEEIQTHQRRQGMSLMIATHHLGLARRLADYLVLLLDGNLLGAGDAHSMFTTPPSARARDLLVWGS